MATVVNVSVSSDNPQASGDRYVTYQYGLLDNQGSEETVSIGPKSVPAGFDALTDAQSLSTGVLASQKVREQESFKQGLRDGHDPFHTDMGGGYEKNDPAWGTWEEQFTANAPYFWSRSFHLDILPFADCWGRVSSNDKKAALGIDNQDVTAMNGDMQVAVDTKASLDAYAPYFTE